MHVTYISERGLRVLIMMMRIIFKPILMHNPVGFLTMWGSTAVEHQGFSHSNLTEVVSYTFVSAGRFPESSTGRSVRPRTCRIFPILVAEKVPFILWS